MSSRATARGPTSIEIISTLRELIPELEREWRWPSSIVFETFADHVADRVGAGAANEELEGYFAFVEELAASGDPEVENLVIVDFLEAADWPAERFGPETTRLSDEPDQTIAPTPATAGPGVIHARLIERFPVLGELCFDEVLAEVAQVAWEAHIGGRPDVARRAMAFAEWLAEHGRADLAHRAVSPLFDPGAAAGAGAGPRVLELVRQR